MRNLFSLILVIKKTNNDSYVHVASQTGQKKYKNVIPNVMIFYGCDKKCNILLCRDKAIKNGKYKKKDYYGI